MASGLPPSPTTSTWAGAASCLQRTVTRDNEIFLHKPSVMTLVTIYIVTVSVSVLVPGVLTNQTVVAGAGEIRLSCQVGVVACYL